MKDAKYIYNKCMIKIILSFLLLVSCSNNISSAQQIPTPTPIVGPISQETELSPLVDLYNGGQAVGAAQPITIHNPDGTDTIVKGSLLNGSLLPKSGEGFARLSSPDTSWGAGMMVSLLMNSAAEFSQTTAPGNIVRVGDIAMEFGGEYSPHKSHQSGLDADVLFMGTKNYSSVLDAAGNVTDRFEVQKNWDYWRLLVSQQIMQKGKQISVVSMILVDPRIKTYLCGWAQSNGYVNNPLDREVLRRLRPTEGHDDHFHLRLKCSPHYPQCVQQGDIASGTGCPVVY